MFNISKVIGFLRRRGSETLFFIVDLKLSKIDHHSKFCKDDVHWSKVVYLPSKSGSCSKLQHLISSLLRRSAEKANELIYMC